MKVRPRNQAQPETSMWILLELAKWILPWKFRSHSILLRKQNDKLEISNRVTTLNRALKYMFITE